MKKLILVGPIVLIIIWSFLTFSQLVKPIFLSSPITTFNELWNLSIRGEILNDIFKTLYRLIFGFSLGIAIGIPIGIFIGYSEKVYLSLEAVIDFFRSIPVAALFPLFLLCFGTGDLTKICTAAWSTSLIVLINTMYGVKHSKKIRIMVAKTMRISKYQMFTKIIFPDALPEIFAGLRIGLSIALIVVIMTEMFMGTSVGLGLRIFNASLLYRTSELYATLIVIGILGYLINKLFVFIETKFVHWAGK
ncbi:MAG: ABC transporter permease [bacterium]